MDANRRLCLVILGMDRSGTSALARVLNIAGAKLPADLMGASQSNGTGPWESTALARYHDGLLAEFGSGWDDWSLLDFAKASASRRAEMQADIAQILRSQYGDAPLIVVEDTRVCRFAPLFLEAVEVAGYEYRCVLPLRSPLEVVQSLELRHQMPRGQAALLWLRHTLDAEVATRHTPRALLDYADLVADWPSALGQLKDRLAIALPYDAKEIRPEVDSFLSSEYRLQAATAEPVLFDPMLREWVGQAYSSLLVLKRNPSSAPALDALDRVRREFNNAAPILRRMLDETNGLYETQARHFQGEIVEAHEQASGVVETASELNRRLAALEADSQAGKAKLAELVARSLDLEEELAGAKDVIAAYERRIAQYQVEAATLGARFGRLLTRWRTRLAPSSSWRARLLGQTLKAAERLYRYGPGKSGYTYLASAREGAAESKAIVESAESTIVAASPPDYAAWIDACEPNAGGLAAQRADADLASKGPLISVIIPVYKVPADVLAGTLQSLLRQTYPNWEACIAYADIGNDENWAVLRDFAARDARLRPEWLAKNLGISGNSNAALRNARGAFIALLDHDDQLTPWALYEMARAIVADGEADFLYSDKDTVDESGSIRINPLFKPEWSPEMLYSVNYLTHLNVLRRSVVDEIGGWRSETDGAQDWDLFLRVSEKSRKIVRVRGVHYHWRALPTSVAGGIEAKPYATAAQLRTIKDRVERLGLPAHVMPEPDGGFRLSWRAPRAPDVDLVVQGAGASHTLANLLKQGSHDFRAWVASISIVQDKEAPNVDWRAHFGGLPVRIFVRTSAQDRTGRTLEAASSGDAGAIVFVDNEFETITPGWLDELAGWILGNPDIGFVGSLLLTPSNEVIEAGRVVGAGGASAPLFSGTPLHHGGPIGAPFWFRNISAVSPHAAACRRCLWPAATAREAQLQWRDAFIARCANIRRAGGRGMMSPYVRAVRARREDDSSQYWNETFRDDPFFHPAFASVTPLRIGAAGA